LIDAQNALQKAIVATAEADAGLTALIAQRLYDRPPQNPTHPYVTFGPFQSVDSSDQCHDGVEVFVELNVWSRDVGMGEAQAVSKALTLALDNELSVSGFEVQIHEVEGVFTNRDTDNLTIRSRINLRYVLAPTA
jgi:hypothetical protein